MIAVIELQEISRQEQSDAILLSINDISTQMNNNITTESQES